MVITYGRRGCRRAYHTLTDHRSTAAPSTVHMEFSRIWKPPAITTGLVLFYILLRVVGATNTLILTPDALFHLDLNRLSFYPLVFFSWLHLTIGVALFTPICGQFELRNGTVRTGVVLNITAFLVGIVVNLIAKVSGGKLVPSDFCGTSSWIFAFSAFLSVTSWSLPVIPIRSVVVKIPTWIFLPIAYAIVTVLTPQFAVVHGLAMLMGFGLGLGYLGFLVDGTTNVVEWIESKIEIGINGLRFIVRFVGEVEARDLRLVGGRGRSDSIHGDEIPLPPTTASLTNPMV